MDTVITQMESDSSFYEYDYYKYDSPFVELFEKSFDEAGYLKALIFTEYDRFKQFYLDSTVQYHDLLSNDLDIYSITNKNNNPYTVCIERFHINNFEYPKAIQMRTRSRVVIHEKFYS